MAKLKIAGLEDRATRRNRARKLKLDWRSLPVQRLSKIHDQIYIPVPRVSP